MTDSNPLSSSQRSVDSTLESLLDDCAAAIEKAERLVPESDVRNVEAGARPAWAVDAASRAKADSEPLRVIHHLACTGGTLISKCLSVMPNTLLLSEIDPFSPLPEHRSRFAPTDLIRLVQNAGMAEEHDLYADMFLAGLNVLIDHCHQRGIRLVLRDHSHSQFCVGDAVREAPSMTTFLQERFTVLSVLTVRHPIDSYLSLVSNKWLHFQPATIEEYARRYIAFLDAYRGAPVFKYEDFVGDPTVNLKRLCAELDLAFRADAIDLFSAVEMSGDSGRKSERIAARERRLVSDALMAELYKSRAFCELCERLGYGMPEDAQC